MRDCTVILPLCQLHCGPSAALRFFHHCAATLLDLRVGTACSEPATLRRACNLIGTSLIVTQDCGGD